MPGWASLEEALRELGQDEESGSSSDDEDMRNNFSKKFQVNPVTPPSSTERPRPTEPTTPTWRNRLPKSEVSQMTTPKGVYVPPHRRPTGPLNPTPPNVGRGRFIQRTPEFTSVSPGQSHDVECVSDLMNQIDKTMPQAISDSALVSHFASKSKSKIIDLSSADIQTEEGDILVVENFNNLWNLRLKATSSTLSKEG